jgi:flagellum-specific ATP synthase
VVGFRDNTVLLMPLGDMEGIGPGSSVIATGSTLKVPVGEGMLGRVLNGLGVPIDGLGPLKFSSLFPVTNPPPNPLERRRITEILELGIKSVDGLLTCGKGQRIGVFSGSGVGKSTLLGMIARNTSADINVIGLVGERGREVREFIENDLGEEGLKRSVVVVATSDQPALVRLKSAQLVTAIAEFFRSLGKDVMLMMDSLTKFPALVNRGAPPSDTMKKPFPSMARSRG